MAHPAGPASAPSFTKGRLLLLLCGAVTAGAAQPAPAREVPSITLTYFNAPPRNMPIRNPPTLGLAVGSGEVHRAVMDTGSTGVVISATSIGNLENLPVLGSGTLTYTSSGRVMQGIYVRTAVTVIGANGATITTRPIPVLAVERIDCLASARHCQPQLNPRGVAMLGIGFAREKDRERDGTPDTNPFLNLPEMGEPGRPGPLRRGYVVRRGEVEVGLRGNTLTGKFETVALSPDSEHADWTAPRACISVARRSPPACGTVLVDTGVTVMYLSVPEDQSDGLEHVDVHGHPVLADGTELQILPGPGDAAPSYGFRVGAEKDPLVPEEVVLVGSGRRPPFVNTTVRALNAYDYAYDADAGLVGFRPLAAH